MYAFRKTRTSVEVLIHKMFPESVTLCWYNVGDTVVTVHYFQHLGEDRAFCLVQDTWWKIEYRCREYHDGCGNVDYIEEASSVMKVDSPEDAIYDYSVSFRWNEERDGAFDSIAWIHRTL